MEDLEGPLRGKKNICIGLVQPEAMTRRMRRMLEECFGKVEFVDCTQMLLFLLAPEIHLILFFIEFGALASRAILYSCSATQRSVHGG